MGITLKIFLQNYGYIQNYFGTLRLSYLVYSQKNKWKHLCLYGVINMLNFTFDKLIKLILSTIKNILKLFTEYKNKLSYALEQHTRVQYCLKNNEIHIHIHNL